MVVDQAFPLELKVPDAETQADREESRAMMARRRKGQNRFADLEKNSGSKSAALPRAADDARAFLKDGVRLSHSGAMT